MGDLDGVSVEVVVFGQVEGLPAPQPGVYYIVSGLVLSAASDRPDLLAPGQPVRDEAGRVIGCKAWTTTPAFQPPPAPPAPEPTDARGLRAGLEAAAALAYAALEQVRVERPAKCWDVWEEDRKILPLGVRRSEAEEADLAARLAAEQAANRAAERALEAKRDRARARHARLRAGLKRRGVKPWEVVVTSGDHDVAWSPNWAPEPWAPAKAVDTISGAVVEPLAVVILDGREILLRAKAHISRATGWVEGYIAMPDRADFGLPSLPIEHVVTPAEVLAARAAREADAEAERVFGGGWGPNG